MRWLYELILIVSRGNGRKGDICIIWDTLVLIGILSYLLGLVTRPSIRPTARRSSIRMRISTKNLTGQSSLILTMCGLQFPKAPWASVLNTCTVCGNTEIIPIEEFSHYWHMPGEDLCQSCIINYVAKSNSELFVKMNNKVISFKI